MSLLLLIMHYQCFHYYMVITHFYGNITIIAHYYMLPTVQLADGRGAIGLTPLVTGGTDIIIRIIRRTL